MVRALIALLTGAGFIVGASVPIIPTGEMTLLYSYTNDCDKVRPTTVATTTIKGDFKPATCVDSFAASVFRDSRGDKFTVEIPKARYTAMGSRGGIVSNPTKTEFQSLFELTVPVAEAAIGFDAASDIDGATGTSLTIAHTTSGVNRLLLVGVQNGNEVTANLTGITYNGVAMTEQDTEMHKTGNYFTHLFYLIAPDTGTNNIVISFAASTPGAWANNASYTGVAQTGFPDAASTTAKVATSVNHSVTTIADNAWTAMYGTTDGVNITTATDGTLRGTGRGGGAIGDSNAPITPPGSDTLTFNSDGNPNPTTAHMVSFAPASESVTPTGGNSATWFSVF